MTKRSTTPIESFGSELFNALVEGSKRKIEVHCDFKTAVRARMRMHQLRHRMREEGHDLYSVVARTKITISWPEGTETYITPKKTRFPKDLTTPVTLTLAPQDSEFGDMFKKAGLDLKPLDIETATPPDTERTPTLEDLLKDFK